MKIQQIEISFPAPVELPDGFDQTLSCLIGMVCKQYEKENPTRVMWAAGHGSKPIWNEPNEPDFDSSVYVIDVSEREDTAGSNKYNPYREKLKAEARKQREERKKNQKCFGCGYKKSECKCSEQPLQKR